MNNQVEQLIKSTITKKVGQVISNPSKRIIMVSLFKDHGGVKINLDPYPGLEIPATQDAGVFVYKVKEGNWVLVDRSEWDEQ